MEEKREKIINALETINDNVDIFIIGIADKETDLCAVDMGIQDCADDDISVEGMLSFIMAHYVHDITKGGNASKEEVKKILNDIVDSAIEKSDLLDSVKENA